MQHLDHVKLISCLALPARMQKKKLGDLNLFTQKLARLSFLLQIKKEHFSCMSILIIFCFE